MTFTDDEVDVLASEWTTFCETVWPASVEDWLMPSTADEVFVFGFELVVDNLLTELPVMVLMPADVTMPRICPELEFPELLLRFATVFPVILALVLLVAVYKVSWCGVRFSQ